MVHTDKDSLRSILKNLLDNAKKYSATDSRIQVTLAEEGVEGERGVEVSILNQVGDAGLPDVDRLFTKYYRSKGAHRQPGSGLGLFLVSGWSKALGGTIRFAKVTDADGPLCAKFSLWLPG